MFLTTCIIIPARSYLVNAFFEFFQNYLYKFPAGSCIRILGHRAVRLELPPHLLRRVSGAVLIHPLCPPENCAKQKVQRTFIRRTFLVGAGGFEPPKLKAADLQSVPIGHSGTRPYSFVSAARTSCVYYHAQSSLSTICNRFYRNFCTNLSNKLAPWKNRPEINVPERFFLELVTGVEPATH